MTIEITIETASYEWTMDGDEKDIREFIENLSIALVDTFDVYMCRERNVDS